MYNIIPLLLILVSLSIIIVIVARKFPVLANLDVANIPAEKEARFKERIISNRLKRNVIKRLAKLSRLFAPFGRSVSDFFKLSLHRLDQLRNDYLTREAAQDVDIAQKIEQLFIQAEELGRDGDLAGAENRYIAIIGLDSRNFKAFKKLGRVYFEKKQYEEARQTFEHVLKLKKDDEDVYENLAQIAQKTGDLNKARDEYLKLITINKQNAQTHFSLACVYQAMGRWMEATGSLKKALRIEPANPKYLDTMLETSIIVKDKALALDTYRKLSEVNPENNKLVEFKKQINEM
jgi:tetratricopeptide (TPR) repeat protein